ncbi:MAG TPA: hypothetical protein VEY95_07235 [Azospirillaceae bacterium]|nr:hypothetical protein [Azospirillaceae bacterium]
MAMDIRDENGLQEAVQEFQKLAAAQDGTPEATRRAELDAAIKAYCAQHNSEDRYARPM